MSREDMKSCVGLVLAHSKAKARFTIAADQAVMIVRDDLPPVQVELDGAGTYDVEAEEIAPGCVWPVVLMVIPKADAAAFLTMPASYATQIIEGVRAQIPGALQTSSEPKGTEGGA